MRDDDDNRNSCTIVSKTALIISEDDVEFLIQRFPSMSGRFKRLLKRLLSSFQNKQKNEDCQNRTDDVYTADNDNEEENDESHEDRNNSNEEEEDYVDSMPKTLTFISETNYRPYPHGSKSCEKKDEKENS